MTLLANIVTLGARDSRALREFYKRLGWPVLLEDEDFVAFGLRGCVICLFPVDKLAADGRVQPEAQRSGLRFTIGITVDSPAEVDELTERFRQAGARVTKEPVDAEFFDGRSAYLADPEDNYFEIVWARNNPITAAARDAANL